MDKKTFDVFGKEVNISENSFDLVQTNEKIHDTKFETKPTTFAKDAFKRFCKNKSSVVAAVIIGLLIILSIIVPIASPYDVSNSHPAEYLLRPKLFEAGTGFWDGTKRLTGITYDTTNNRPAVEYSDSSISNIVIYEKDGYTYCDFTYDVYEDRYGVKEMTVSKIDVDVYKENGWIELGSTPESFKKLSEESPILSVKEVKENGDVVAEVLQYRYLGYDHMPKFLFGTDNNGRDMIKLAFTGLRSSLIVAFFVAAFCFMFGLIWGAISGYFGGNTDLFMERLKDILAGVPIIVVVTLAQLHLGDTIFVFAFALCITSWIGVASRTRTQFYRFKGREYVLASRTLGAKDTRLIFRHILPNSLGTIVTSSILMIPNVIFMEATLSYLGLGIKGSLSFGRILADNQTYLQTYPALILFPAVIISLLMISFNLFGNGLRDALNPSLKGSE